MPSKACGRNPATCCSASPIIPSVWAMVDVAERDLGALAVGQQVTVRARSFPGRTFSGKVALIYPHINKETRTARVRIELPNPDMLLLPDMYVDAEIETGSPSAVLTVPDSAVIDSGSRQAVFVDKGEGRFEPREVRLGRRGERLCRDPARRRRGRDGRDLGQLPDRRRKQSQSGAEGFDRAERKP